MFTERPYPSLDREAIRGKTIRLFREPEVKTSLNRLMVAAAMLKHHREAIEARLDPGVFPNEIEEIRFSLGAIQGVEDELRAAAQQEKP